MRVKKRVGYSKQWQFHRFLGIPSRLWWNKIWMFSIGPSYLHSFCLFRFWWVLITPPHKTDMTMETQQFEDPPRKKGWFSMVILVSGSGYGSIFGYVLRKTTTCLRSRSPGWGLWGWTTSQKQWSLEVQIDRSKFSLGSGWLRDVEICYSRNPCPGIPGIFIFQVGETCFFFPKKRLRGL